MKEWERKRERGFEWIAKGMIWFDGDVFGTDRFNKIWSVSFSILSFSASCLILYLFDLISHPPTMLFIHFPSIFCQFPNTVLERWPLITNNEVIFTLTKNSKHVFILHRKDVHLSHLPDWGIKKCIKNRRLKVMTGQISEWRKWNMMMHRCSFACRLTREGKWGKKIEDRILSSFFSSLQQRKKEKRRERRIRRRKGSEKKSKGMETHFFDPWINTCIWARSIWCINFLQNCRQNERCVFLLFSLTIFFFPHLLATSLSPKDQVLSREGRGFPDDRKWWREWSCSKLQVLGVEIW